MRTLKCALFAIGLTGCFRVIDLDRYQESAPPPPPPSADGVTSADTADYTSLRVTVVAMKPHTGQMMEFRVVDGHNFIQSRMIVSAMATLDATINVPAAIPKPNGPYRLDFYADVNFSGGYDGLGSVLANDHAWRIDPLADYPEGTTPIPGLVQVRFVHNTSFTDIDQYPSGVPNKAADTGLGAKVHVVGMDAYQGKMAQVRIADRGSHHVVATYRVPEVRGGGFEAAVPGSVEQGTDYDVDLYVDVNGNGAYDDPTKDGGDLGLRAGGTSDETGLDVTVDASHTDAKLDVGAP
jgi:hypothetical protein